MLQFHLAVPAVARSLATAPEVGPNVQALVTSANKIQVRADLLIDVVAKTNVQSRRGICSRDVVIARSVGSLAVCLGQLLLRPGLFYIERLNQPMTRLLYKMQSNGARITYSCPLAQTRNRYSRIHRWAPPAREAPWSEQEVAHPWTRSKC